MVYDSDALLYLDMLGVLSHASKGDYAQRLRSAMF